MNKVNVIPVIAEDYLKPENFFINFDENAFMYKIESLLYALSNHEAIVKSNQSFDHYKFSSYIRAEIYFTVIHNIETLISLSLCVFKNQPIVITMIQADNASEYACNILDKKYAKLSNDHATDRKRYFSMALLGGIVAQEEQAKLVDLVETSAKFFEHCCRIFVLAGDAYNSYKHGMRLNPGSIKLEVKSDLHQHQDYITVLDSSDSLQYLKKDKNLTDKIHRAYELEDHVFDLETSVEIAKLIVILFKNIKIGGLAFNNKNKQFSPLDLPVNIVEDIIGKADLFRSASFGVESLT